MTAKISVLVAIKDVAAYLPRCLDSLTAQTLSEAEFILVEDGGSDASWKICQTYAAKDARFQLVKHETNQGCVITRLDGFAQARGDYVLLLDGDDYLLDSTTLSDIAALAERENVDMLRFSLGPFGEAVDQGEVWVQDLTKNEPCRLLGGAPLLTHVFTENRALVSVIGVCYRRELWERMVPFARREHLVLAEDGYLNFLLMTLAESYCCVETRPYYQYRVGSGVSSGASQLKRFPMRVRALEMIAWLREFLQHYEGITLTHSAALDALESHLLDGAITAVRGLPLAEQPTAMAMLAPVVDIAVFYRRFLENGYGLSNDALLCVPKRRLFRAWLKLFLGLKKAPSF